MGNEQSTAGQQKSHRYTKVERLHEKVERLLRFDAELNKEVDAIFRDSSGSGVGLSAQDVGIELKLNKRKAQEITQKYIDKFGCQQNVEQITDVYNELI